MTTMSKTGTCWYVAQLQANPLAVTTTGFELVAYNSTHALGMQLLGTSSTTLTPATATAGVTAAGTYYAKKQSATQAQCYAGYPETLAGGFVWGNSFSSPGVD
jgi:hypothetical protein